MADHGSWTKVLTHAARVTDPASRFGAQFAEMADKVGMSPEHCMVYLARRVAEVRSARARALWWGGRFQNWVTGAETETVAISGAVLMNSLNYLGEDVPDSVSRRADIALRFDAAERLERDVRARAVAEGLLA